MKLGSANLLKAGKRELRSLGDDCDDACFPAYCCGNFELHGICRGFKLLNGENRKKLNAMLTDDDVLYIESCMRMIQNGHNEDVLVPEVLRYLKRPEDRPRESGFLGMIEASRGVPTTPTPKQTEPEMRGGWGFRAMLTGASRGNATGYSIETRDPKPIPCGFAAMLESMFPTKPRETSDERPYIRRGMGFANMLNDAARGT